MEPLPKSCPNQLRPDQLRSTHPKPAPETTLQDYSTTTQPHAHPNLKALSPASLAQQEHGTHGSFTICCYGQPHHLQGNDSNSAAWGTWIWWNTFMLYAQERFCKTDISAKVLIGNYIRSAGCCTYYFLGDKYIVKLRTELFLQQSVQLYNHIGTSIQNTGPMTFEYYTFQDKKARHHTVHIY